MDDPTRDLYRVTRPDGTITHKSARDYGRPEHGARREWWEAAPLAHDASDMERPRVTPEHGASTGPTPADDTPAWCETCTYVSRLRDYAAADRAAARTMGYGSDRAARAEREADRFTGHTHDSLYTAAPDRTADR